MKTKIKIAIVFACIFSSLSAQNYQDGIRYSQTLNGGTARFMSMGGAFGALGGDFSTLSYNPAGLGVYRGTEFLFTPSFTKFNAKSSLFDNSSTDYKYNFNINNLGFITTYNTGKDDGWANINYGIGYNQLVNFSNSVLMQNSNDKNPPVSLSDFFTYRANGMHPDDLGAYYNSVSDSINPNWINPYYPNELDAFSDRMAYDGYLIDTLSGKAFKTPVNPADSNKAKYYYPGISLNQDQRRTITSSGNVGEWVFSVGGNYAHKLYIGGTIGVQAISYSTVMNHTEQSLVNDPINSFTYREELVTTGTGLNFKVGAIYKPIDILRFGFAYHSPTFCALTDIYYNSLTTNYYGEQLDMYPTDEEGYKYEKSKYDYEITTPMKAIGSVALQIEKKALISLDYEYIDYSTIRLRDGGDGYDFYEQNNEINNALKATANIRGGAELRFDKLYLRGGYAYYGSPYKNNELNKNASYSIISGGFGVRGDNMFFDLAYSQRMQNVKYVLYDLGASTPISSINYTTGQVLATVGWRF